MTHCKGKSKIECSQHKECRMTKKTDRRKSYCRRSIDNKPKSTGRRIQVMRPTQRTNIKTGKFEGKKTMSRQMETLYEGPRGGYFYLTPKGNKRYVK